MITADFCILPMGIESSEIGEYVAEAVEVIQGFWNKIRINRNGNPDGNREPGRALQSCSRHSGSNI